MKRAFTLIELLLVIAILHIALTDPAHVRHVQALARLHDWGTVDEGNSAYIQARHRLPQECLERVLAATAQAAERRAAGSSGLQGRPVKGIRQADTSVDPGQK
jgi:prepilin-type N-terminal cleavage/methylation domain-containing protein